MSEPSEPRGGGPIPMVLGAGLMVVGAFVPLPGIDTEALAEIGTPLTFIGATAPWLAAIYLVLISRGRNPSSAAQRVAVGLYFVVALVQGLGVAFWLESLGGFAYGLDVVAEPGWRFRILIMLAWAAGAGLLWIAAAAIGRTGRAQGALFLLLLYTCIRFVRESVGVGDAFGRGDVEAFPLVCWALVPAAFVGMAFVLAARPVAEWPLELPGTRLRSAWDALALITVSAIPDSVIESGFAMSGTPAPGWSRWIGVLLGVAVCVQVARWWWRAGERDNPRPRVAIGYAAAFVLLASGGFVLGLTQSSGLARMFEPGPLEGDSAFTLVLDADEQFGADDGRAMVARLEALGPRVEVVSQSATSITLRITDAVGPEPVLEALRPLRPAVSLVREIRPEEISVPARVQTVSDPRTMPSAEADCDALDAWLNEPRESARCLYRVERGEMGSCVLHCLDPQPVLTAADIDSARVIFDEWSNMPTVQLTLTSSAAQRFGEVTGQNLGRRLAITVDERVVSAPVIMSAIPGGQVQITLGHAERLDVMLAQAQALSAALQPGSAAISPWTLARVE